MRDEDRQKVNLSFPWLSAVVAIGLITLFLLVFHSQSLSFRLPPQIVHSPTQIGLCLFFLAVLAWDVRRFYVQRKSYDQTLAELFRAKRQLQMKAHAYSGHTDKLKLFISERLLEYIQYDEKFLHFKSIAAEVRHNGVICFDQVQTALTEAINSYEQHANESISSPEVVRCQTAIKNMRYLWDLLDLSTADNISLQVGNYLCECEEHYFQSLLRENQESPYIPTYQAHRVILDVLVPSLENANAILHSATSEDQQIQYSDSHYFVLMDKGVEMLGNENHLRLLAENLVNNAQFYMKKRNAVKTQKPVAIELRHKDNQMHLVVYNRGDHIDEESRDKIFQLGFSTRRKKGNHGKGLGLYFANSIAQGYEGNIRFSNVDNQVDTYSVRIELENGDLFTEIVQTVLVEDLPAVVLPDDKETKKQMEWKFSHRILSIELFSKRFNHTYIFTGADLERETHTDPENATIPSWVITTVNRKRSSKLRFTPMDIRGLKFEVSLPTAKARLDYSEDSDLADSDIDKTELDRSYDNIIELEKRFRG